MGIKEFDDNYDEMEDDDFMWEESADDYDDFDENEYGEEE